VRRATTITLVMLGGLLSATSGARDRATQLAQRASHNASCAGCHPDIAAEWTRSLHQQAWRDPVFTKAYAIEPLAFCRGCHAPESDPARDPTATAQAVGVGCVSCHLDERDAVHATRAANSADHALVVDAELATPKFCARCHEFDFPVAANQRHPQAMQDTFAEHARSDRSTTSCQDCHMPVVDGGDGKHRSHAFSVIADRKMIESAVSVSVARRETSSGPVVDLTLTAAQVGHAFPTGDMFRRVEIEAVAIDAADKIVAQAEPVLLERRFADRPRNPGGRDLGFQRIEVSDTRVPPPGTGVRRVQMQLPASASRDLVRYRVVYQRMSTPMAAAFGVAQVLDEVVLAQGELSAQSVAQLGALR
jgi:Cytochrome c554 and c-prime